jgi:hypothetical protein
VGLPPPLVKTVILFHGGFWHDVNEEDQLLMSSSELFWRTSYLSIASLAMALPRSRFRVAW